MVLTLAFKRLVAKFGMLTLRHRIIANAVGVIEALPVAVRALGDIDLRRRVQESLYKRVCFAATAELCCAAAGVSNPLPRCLQVSGVLLAFFQGEARAHTRLCLCAFYLYS
jgi:hypothetical protein